MSRRTVARNQTTLVSRQEVEDALNHCESLRHTDPAGTLHIALETGERARQGGFTDLQGRALIRCSEASFRLGRIGHMGEYMQKADDVLSVTSSLREKLYLYNAWAIYYQAQGEPVRAYEYLQRVLRLSVSAEHRASRGNALLTIGILLSQTGVYDTALTHLLECLEIAEQEQDQLMIAAVLGNIGLVYLQLEDYHRALEYFQRAFSLRIDRNDIVGMALDLRNIAATYSMLQDYPQVIEYLQRSLEIVRNLGNKEFEASLLAGLGKAHAQSGELTLALSYVQEALLCAEDSKDRLESAFILLSLGTIHQMRKEYDAALNACLESMQLHRRFESRNPENEVRKKVSEIYEEMGDYQKSLEYHREYLKVRQELQGAEMQRSVAGLEVRRALEKAEEEKELLRRQAEQACKEMEERMKELNALTVDLTERNEALKSIRVDLLPLLRATEEKTRKNASRIVRQIEEVVTEEKKNLFQEQFEQVYQEFIRQLRELCPSLTPAEIRICVLIKLNLSNKQIAEMLFASPLTVKTHRAHIRRKLGLGKRENLSSILFAM